MDNHVLAKLNKLTIFCLLLSVVLWLQACGQQTPSPQDSCNFVQNSDGQRVSWGPSVPVTLYVDNSVPNQYYASIEAAAATWNKTMGRTLLTIGGWVNKPSGPAQDNTNVIYWMKNWDPTLNYEQARTTIYWTGNRINEADILVDSVNFTYSTGTPILGQVDFQSLILHELGHVLGLKHVVNASSVMLATLPDDYLRQTPQSIDVSDVKCEY